MKVTSLDNIDQKVLDTLVEKYKDDPKYKVLDDRKKLSFNKPREYFLICKYRKGVWDREWTFIWIGDNLWQFSYLNTECMSRSKWVSPVELLNKLLEL